PRRHLRARLHELAVDARLSPGAHVEAQGRRHARDRGQRVRWKHRLLITISDLSKWFGRTKAVDHLSFEVRPGTVTGFLGPNGSGKSTTMRCMLGLDRPDTGGTLFDGKAYRQLSSPLHEVGALLDAGYVHPGRSGRNHLRWLAASNRLPRARVDEVLDLVGLTTVGGRRVKTYSLGMRQRLGLAGVLLGDPHIVVL